MAKKRETSRKVKTLAAKTVRPGEAKRVKGGPSMGPWENISLVPRS
jgi:hypothetical protein